MQNLLFLLIIVTISSLSMIVGVQRAPVPDEANRIISPSVTLVPYIGKLEVLNGCGISGAAGAVADFLRDRSFDVKDIENAKSWNYPETMVISRVENDSIAVRVSQSLGVDHTTLIRNGQEDYDVTVIVGTDFSSLLKKYSEKK